MEGPNPPSHTIWQVIESDQPGERSFFRSIGAAWPNKKGSGYNIVLEAVPLFGRIAMTARKPDDAQEGVPADEDLPG